MTEPTFSVSGDSRTPVIELRGSWRLVFLPQLERTLRAVDFSSAAAVRVDGRGLDEIDTSGALLLLERLLPGRSVEFQNLSAAAERILNIVKERYHAPAASTESAAGILNRVGQQTFSAVIDFGKLLDFIGRSAVESARTACSPKLLRSKELVIQLEQCGVQAVPVIAMMMFLIGIVIAYLFAIQIEKYGANIFIVDGVAIALCRELSPVIVAIIVAGRSGSAFTAQLGTMKLNEELDAMAAIGLSPMRVLILPRFLAMIFALPALTFIGDAVGILGGMVIADLRLGITMPTFISRLQDVLTVRSFSVGLIKAPVFAAFIAVIGCRMGLNVENNALSIGLSTTRTVVHSIVAVILINAAFAIIFTELRI